MEGIWTCRFGSISLIRTGRDLKVVTMVRWRCVGQLDWLNVSYYVTVPIWKFGWCSSPNGDLVWLNVAGGGEICCWGPWVAQCSLLRVAS